MGQNQALGVRSGFFIGKLRPQGGGTDGFMGINPVLLRTLALWGRCSKREITWLRSNSEVTFYLYLLFLKLNI